MKDVPIAQSCISLYGTIDAVSRGLLISESMRSRLAVVSETYT